MPSISAFDEEARLSGDRQTLAVGGDLTLPPETEPEDAQILVQVVSGGNVIARGSGRAETKDRWSAALPCVPGVSTGTQGDASATVVVFDLSSGVWSYSWARSVTVVDDAGPGPPKPRAVSSQPRGLRAYRGASGQHGAIRLRDESLRTAPPAGSSGRYRRLLPGLPSFAAGTADDDEALRRLGAPGGPMDAGNSWNRDEFVSVEGDAAAGWAFFGQFVDHDITFDATSSLGRQQDPGSVRDYRTPLLELDSLYGSGRAVSSYLYDPFSAGAGRFLTDFAFPRDLPRSSRLTALIADPRNDTNVIVAQLHLAFLRLHNTLFDRHLEAGMSVDWAFAEAQREVRWTYQWIIVNEFLPDLVEQEILDEVHGGTRLLLREETSPFVPVEFAVAAFRYGHSQVQPGYVAHRDGDGLEGPILDQASDGRDLAGGKRAPWRYVDWSLFFGPGAQTSRPIGPTISSPLFRLPFEPPLPLDQTRSLPQRTLLRHLTFGLPSGPRVARALGEDPVDDTKFRSDGQLPPEIETPLWCYVLVEAQARSSGRSLGPVGGRIVAEVLLALLAADGGSYLRQEPGWNPPLGGIAGVLGLNP